jgi:hypothetical protein
LPAFLPAAGTGREVLGCGAHADRLHNKKRDFTATRENCKGETRARGTSVHQDTVFTEGERTLRWP